MVQRLVELDRALDEKKDMLVKRFVDFDRALNEAKASLTLETHNAQEPQLKAEAEKNIKEINAKIKKIRAETEAEIEKVKNNKKDGKQVSIIQLRDELNSFENELAIHTISCLDGLLTVPILLNVINELCQKNEEEISDAFQQLTGKTLSEIFNAKDIRDVFTKILGKSIEDLFSQFLKGKKSHEVTQEGIDNLINQIVSKFFASEALQSILDSLEEKKQEIINYLTQFITTHIFLLCVHELFSEADRKQNIGIAKLIWEMRNATEHLIRKPFIAVNACLPKISVTKKSESLWQEFSLITKGMFTRTYRAIPYSNKNEKGEVLRGQDNLYPTGDDQDATLKKYLGMTKFDIALYQNEMSEGILRQINAAKEGKSLVVDLTCYQKHRHEKVQLDDRLIPFIKKIDAELHETTKGDVTVLVDDTKFIIVTSVPKTKTKLADHIEHINKLKLITKLQITKAAEIEKELNGCKNGTVDEKLDCLRNVINKYELTAMQLKLLFFIPDDISMHFGRFIHDYEKSWWGSAVHVNDANERIKLSEKTVNPVLLLACLFTFRDDLINDDPQNLLPKINKILLAAFDYLRLGVAEFKIDWSPIVTISLKPQVSEKLKEKISASVMSFINKKKEQKPKQAEVPLNEGVFCSKQENCHHIVTIIDKNKETLLQHLREINTITVKGKYQLAEPDVYIADDLVRIDLVDESDHIRRLYFCINTFELSEKQIATLEEVAKPVMQYFQQYIDSNSKSGWFISLLYKFNRDKQKHTILVEEQLKDLKRLEGQIHPIDLMQTIYKMLIILFQDNSGTLLPKISQIPVEAHQKLSGGLENTFVIVN